MLRTIVLLPVFLLALPGSAIAQLDDLPRQTPTALILEITYYKNAAPTFLALSRPDGKPASAWTGRFRRIQNWQLPAGQLPVRAVNFVSRLDGEVAFITVSLFRGIKFHDQETMVGTFQLRENESVSVQELEGFGVEPFRIGVKRIAPAVPDQPVVKSLAKSLEIVGIEPLTSTLPRYKLTLRNLSNKNISAFSIVVLSGGVVTVSSIPQGTEGLPLIKAGAYYESSQPLYAKALQTPGGFTPDATISQETVITALVFDDGSYEGDPAWAAWHRAHMLGRKVALTRLIEVFAAMEGAVPSEQERAAQVVRFRDRVRTVSDEIDQAALAQLMGEFPTLNRIESTRLKTAAEVTLNRVRKELLDDLAQFEKSQPADFRSWLAKVEERYKTWLSRL